MKKRYRIVPAKPGELKAYWGRADKWSGLDICYAWGPGCHGADGRLLHSMISCKRMGSEFPSGKTIFEPSFIDELEARGYDITTIKFSIQKKKVNEEV